MSLCAACSSDPPATSEATRGLCAHHLTVEDGWAEGNRILCDFIHRHVVPDRLPPDLREASEHEQYRYA